MSVKDLKVSELQEMKVNVFLVQEYTETEINHNIITLSSSIS